MHARTQYGTRLPMLTPTFFPKRRIRHWKPSNQSSHTKSIRPCIVRRSRQLFKTTRKPYKHSWYDYAQRLWNAPIHVQAATTIFLKPTLKISLLLVLSTACCKQRFLPKPTNSQHWTLLSRTRRHSKLRNAINNIFKVIRTQLRCIQSTVARDTTSDLYITETTTDVTEIATRTTEMIIKTIVMLTMKMTPSTMIVNIMSNLVADVVVRNTAHQDPTIGVLNVRLGEKIAPVVVNPIILRLCVSLDLRLLEVSLLYL